MIINAGNRRLVSSRFGWRIEVKAVNQKTGAERWVEDRPAYPSSLAQACEMLCERVLTDGPDLTIDQLPGALRNAEKEVRRYMQLARGSA